jgi:hypothetical protein
MSAILRLHDVCKSFGGNHVLTGLNFGSSRETVERLRTIA